MQKTSDLRIADRQEVISASTLLSDQPISQESSETVFQARKSFSEILNKKDSRLAVVVCPCSIHDTSSAMDYAHRLKEESLQYKDQLHIIMRVYFEKPRTTVGWKGLINDPDLDDSFQIDKGLSIARQLLRDINDMGLPAGTEFLDVITPQYIADLISWGAIGARTTESQVHRELASGSSCPIGFKNSTYGGVQVAADAIGSAHNLLSALVDNAVQRNQIDNMTADGITWNRVTDVLDRGLRNIVTGLGGSNNAPLRETSFDIVTASEIMAIMALSKDLDDLRNRLETY